MEEDKNKNVVNHFEAGSNCQVFNAPVSGCVFAMPGSTVTQNALQPVRDLPEEQSPNEKGEEQPAELATPHAQELWEEAQEHGWVDEHLQPLLSRPLAALLADRMAEVLGIKAKWKVFEKMWHRKNMRNDYNTALDQQQCDDFRKKLMRVIR